MKRWLIMTVLFWMVGVAMCAAGDSMPRVRLTTTLGVIDLELNQTAAPSTVDNFMAYVNDGFYDGTLFHRVIAGFMIQGGGFDTQMRQKPTRPAIANEAANGLTNRVGTIAMARTPDPHSATAQFFINANDNDALDHRAKTRKGWGYCVFGRVISGMNVVRAIEHVATTTRMGMRDVPMDPVVILKARPITAE